MTWARTLVCPHCLHTFPPSGLRWVDANGSELDALPTIPRGWRRLQRLAERSAPEPTGEQIADWVARGGHPVCPNGDRLPPEMTDRDTIVVGLVGERGSSKSHYLAALVALLMDDGVLARFDLAVELLPDSSQRFRELYYEPLFVGRTRIEPTQPLQGNERREPITLVLRNLRTSRAVNLVLFDASGEQQISSADQARYNRFLYVASAVLLFVPPTALRGVREKLPDVEALQLTPTTSAIFDQTAEQLRLARRLRSDEDLDGVAAAVLLSKVDQLRGVDTFDDELLIEPDYDLLPAAAIYKQIEDDGALVAAFMEHSGGANLVASLVHRFSGVTFHPVSATGCDLQDGHFPQVRPIRCLDPLFAVLVRLGVIPRDGDDAGD